MAGHSCGPAVEDSCLCLQTEGEDELHLHGVPNPVLQELVSLLRTDWRPGLAGLSPAVASVIQESDPCIKPQLVFGKNCPPLSAQT